MTARTRKLFSAALCLPLSFSSLVTAPPVLAQERLAQGDNQEISPAACQAVGISLPRTIYPTYALSAPRLNAAPPAPPPPPPPPPAPAPERGQ